MTDDFPFTEGQTARASLVIDERVISAFAEFSGDRNPLHVDREAAESYGYARQVAHGVITLALVSRLIGMEIPGPGALWRGQEIEWLAPVFLGDRLEVRLTVRRASRAGRTLVLLTEAFNQDGRMVMKGEARVSVVEKISDRREVTPRENRVALVTGSSRGIGAAVALRLARSGMAVVINGRTMTDDLERVSQEISVAGGRVIAEPCDIADPRAVAALVDRATRVFGALDIVVHGASTPISTVPVQEVAFEDVKTLFDVYVGGALALLAAAVPGMRERKFGRFVVLGTSSLLGTPPAGNAAYVAAKSALWGLVRASAVDLGPHGITVNMVSPGLTVTQLVEHVPARVKELEARRSPMRRLATPADTASVVAFLTSDEASYVNGQNLPLVGGPV